MSYHGFFTSDKYIWFKLLVLVFVPVWLVNEYLIYWIQSWQWPNMPNSYHRDVKSRQVILLVGDHQLVGYQDDSGDLRRILKRWDEYRYMKKTFSLAYSYCKPDVVVYLGDLLDITNTAMGSEFKKCHQRFTSIFELDQQSKLHLDFKDQNPAPELQQTTTADDMKQFNVLEIPVMVNHYPVLSYQKDDVYQIIKRLAPKVIFSTHWNKSELYTCEDCLADDDNSWSVQYQELDNTDSYMHLNLSSPHSMCEITVPTRSYRMGVRHMGYGVAVIDSDNTMHYTVLWLPERYTRLLVYAAAFIIYVFLLGIKLCSRIVFVCTCNARWLPSSYTESDTKSTKRTSIV